jgi:hypothetical protein
MNVGGHSTIVNRHRGAEALSPALRLADFWAIRPRSGPGSPESLGEADPGRGPRSDPTARLAEPRVSE